MMRHDAPTLVDPSVDNGSPVVAGTDGLIAGRYSLLRPLGGGGMGNVFLAFDRVLARQVAVKTLRAELSGSEEVRARIKRECRLQAAIGTHANIVTLYDTVEENGHIYLVMEYVDGETLAARLAAADSRPLPLASALDIVRQILQALICIHRHDIVHRDIKTSNILLRPQPDGRYQAKLTDFGIARFEIEPEAMTRLTSLDVQGPGTPAYMAPERIDPQVFGPVCPATDLYAVGIILYEMLAGRPPFIGSMTEIFSGHLVQPPGLTALAAHVPAQLRAIMMTALAKQPAERYRDGAAFLAALDELDGPAPSLSVQEGSMPAPTVLAVHADAPEPPVAATTILHPAMARARRNGPHWPPRRWAYIAGAGAIFLLMLLGSYLFDRPHQGGSSPDAGMAGATSPSVASPGNDPAAASAEPVSSAPKENSALEVVEQARQPKKVDTLAAARNEPASAAKPPASSAGRTGEWQVTENRTRKIH